MNDHLYTTMLAFLTLCLVTIGTASCSKSAEKKTGDRGKSGQRSEGIKPAPSSVKTPSPSRQESSPTAQSPNTRTSVPPSAANPLPGGPALEVNPVAGLNLAASAQGVLSGGMKLEPGREPFAEEGVENTERTAPNAPSSRSVDDSFVAVKADGDRHPLCKRLLACTRQAVRIAPGSVTSYNVTRESVDSLEPAEAEGECRSDLSDLLDILRHLKKEIPAACR